MRYHLTPVTIASIKNKSKKNKANKFSFEDVEKGESYKLLQYGESFKKLEAELSYDSAVLLLVIYSKEIILKR